MSVTKVEIDLKVTQIVHCNGAQPANSVPRAIKDRPHSVHVGNVPSAHDTRRGTQHRNYEHTEDNTYNYPSQVQTSTTRDRRRGETPRHHHESSLRDKPRHILAIDRPAASHIHSHSNYGNRSRQREVVHKSAATLPSRDNSGNNLRRDRRIPYTGYVGPHRQPTYFTERVPHKSAGGFYRHSAPGRLVNWPKLTYAKGQQRLLTPKDIVKCEHISMHQSKI